MRRDDLRAVLYHRFHARVPLVSNRMMRRLWRVLVGSFWLIYFSFVVLVLALRYSVLPHIEDYREAIERLSSQALGQTVTIGRIEASWQGINPDLTLLDVHISDADGRPALAFSRVEAVLSWWSVPSAKLKLRLLRIDQPTLNLRRDVDGHLLIAGIPLTQKKNDNTISDWILAQRRIRIEGATLVWEDDLRKAPMLELKAVNLALDNDGKRHRFGLTAVPPEEMASKIDLRGDFRGQEIDRLDSWSGKAFVEIDYADLAIWRQWIDYPVALPHGRGAVRTWFNFAEGALEEITADLSLHDVNLRLTPELPVLNLEHMSGRIGARFSDAGFVVNGRSVELLTRDVVTKKKGMASPTSDAHEAIHIAPTDFHIEWQPQDDGKTVTGSASANHLELGDLVRFAEHFPLDAESRQILKDYAPQGRINGLNAKWKGDSNRLQRYTLKADFDHLTLKAQGAFPGFSGLSGVFEGNQKGGNVMLRSHALSIDLPRVFPEPLIELDQLNADIKWKINKGVLDAELSRLEFAGPEAAGSAQGTYRYTGEGPGQIDLTAALSRGDARAVWRYMPHAVNADARHWLRDALLAGHANETKLTLKGKLDDFPFLDKRKGQFLVTVKAQEAMLDYGKDWPKITDVYADLRFEGVGMSINVERGQILGAQIGGTQVEIPDFDAPISLLKVNGVVRGPTSEFLNFIEHSPVTERIDHFTEGMRASGNGHLDLTLAIPLAEAQLGHSKIDGTYHFENNEVLVDSALPTIRQVNGAVHFSGNDLRVPEITGLFLGGPLKIKGGLQKEGKLLISTSGSVNIEQLRKQSDSPLLNSLAGSTAYRAEIHVNKRNADLIVDSSLVGLSSSLPEPFKKTASEALPFHFEKKLLPLVSNRKGEKIDSSVRDQLSASLGSAMKLQFIRRKQGENFVAERGAIAVGQPFVLPASGVALGVTAKQLDLDAWRTAFQPTASAEKSGEKVTSLAANVAADDKAGSKPSALPDLITIKTPDLKLFGRHYNEADLSISTLPTQWKIRLNSRQANGDLLWDSAGNGKLTARLKQLTLEPAESEFDAGDAIKELPALDVVADDFSLGARRFGRLELQARNEGGVWRLSKIQAINPFGTLTGAGDWRIGNGINHTQLDFKIDSSDVGKLLERFGFPGAVRTGSAQLEGRLGWNGAPTELDYASLNGEIKLEASKGQFLKLEPGAGKLLSLISLQSLPRRITLDFKDVFSEGFAFDNISSKVDVLNGVMRTERLQIDGTSARVVMRGETDLKHETQQLNVNVQPELGSTAALGIAIVNPLVGVASLLAHKILRNPLNQMFGFDYRVTGTWEDPKVEKLTGLSPANSTTTVPRLPTITTNSGGGNDSPAK